MSQDFKKRVIDDMFVKTWPVRYKVGHWYCVRLERWS